MYTARAGHGKYRNAPNSGRWAPCVLRDRTHGQFPSLLDTLRAPLLQPFRKFSGHPLTPFPGHQ